MMATGTALRELSLRVPVAIFGFLLFRRGAGISVGVGIGVGVGVGVGEGAGVVDPSRMMPSGVVGWTPVSERRL
ncbi:MAG: hypothetical protein DLM61_02575 [Pseudonocardiales bacterium]|nr:MAG: hypothetical protein DLM61_02575 [Pseudonocardiales bacterium]